MLWVLLSLRRKMIQCSVMKLHDKVALVTGAGRGIGRAIALAFAREGADVAVTARTAAEIEQVATEVTALGRCAVALEVDVSERSAAIALNERVARHFPAVDILVNNAGIGSNASPHRVVDYDDDFWDLSLAVNLTAPYLLTKALLPGMIERGWGRVINMASVAGKRGLIAAGAYTATKHGLIGLTRMVGQTTGIALLGAVFASNVARSAGMPVDVTDASPLAISQAFRLQFFIVAVVIGATLLWSLKSRPEKPA